MASLDIDACGSCKHFDQAMRHMCAPCANATQAHVQEGAPLDRLRRLLPSVVRAVQPEQHISLEGEANGQIIGVVSGLVRCFRLTANGRRHICRFAGAGSIIGLGLLGLQRHSAEAITATQIVVFRAATVDAAMGRNAEVRAAILQALAEELTERERVQLRLGRLNANQRVADFLLEMTAGPGDKTPHEIPMSRADMADHLGVTLETVSRALHRFDRQNLIKLTGSRHYQILKPGALRRFVEGDEDGEPLLSNRREPGAA